MKRSKRTVYILPDLSARIDETASLGGQSPNAIIEAALADYFARESVFGAVETQTRRLGEIEERLAAQQAMLTKMDAAIGAVGRGLVVIRDIVKPPAAPTEPQPVVQDREPEPATAGRPAGGILGGWRR